MAEYTPTTEEIREYVEVGGEPQPWMPPTPAKDAARAAAFDRWLAQELAKAKAEQREADAQIAEATVMCSELCGRPECLDDVRIRAVTRAAAAIRAASETEGNNYA